MYKGVGVRNKRREKWEEFSQNKNAEVFKYITHFDVYVIRCEILLLLISKKIKISSIYLSIIF